MNYSINIPEYKVSQFNKALKELIENNFSYVRIRGEISEVKTATKGQLYLIFKDEDSILSGVIWDQNKRNIKFAPEVGMEVLATGKITTWSKYKTTYQIDIDKIEIAGEGALLKLIEERKKRLKEKGLFNIEHKKQIPYLPNKIGVITSPTGSVIHDIINRISDRFKVPIDLWAVPVQGTEAPASIIKAIKGFNLMNYDEKPDVIIVARGGGSTEDLMAFNDEKLVEAVFESKIPIISAIGHETDTTIIDFVSDLRASTPTAGAEKAVPVKVELQQLIYNLNQRLNIVTDAKLKSDQSSYEKLSKFLKGPEHILKIYNEKLRLINKNFHRVISAYYEMVANNLFNLSKSLKISDNLFLYKKQLLYNFSKHLNNLIMKEIISSKENLQKLSRLLIANSIFTNLKKGYSILTKNNKIVKDSKGLKSKDLLKGKLLDKSIQLEVKKIN